MINSKTRESISPLKAPKLETGGRPAIDWEMLFDEWVRSGQHRVAFLESYGLDPTSARIQRKTKSWNRDTQIAQKSMMKRSKAYDKGTPRPQKEIAEMWQLVQGWRKGQAEKDFAAAEQLREHFTLLLNQATTRNKAGELVTKMSSTSLSRLADVALKIQKMQRLALGMTTENVGIPTLPEPETHVEAEIGPQFPTYIVEVSKDGKFHRPKPRQIL